MPHGFILVHLYIKQEEGSRTQTHRVSWAGAHDTRLPEKKQQNNQQHKSVSRGTFKYEQEVSENHHHWSVYAEDKGDNTKHD